MFDELHSAGQTIILVTHEDNIAAHANRTIRLRDGGIESDVVHSETDSANVLPTSAAEALRGVSAGL